MDIPVKLEQVNAKEVYFTDIDTGEVYKYTDDKDLRKRPKDINIHWGDYRFYTKCQKLFPPPPPMLSDYDEETFVYSGPELSNDLDRRIYWREIYNDLEDILAWYRKMRGEKFTTLYPKKLW